MLKVILVALTIGLTLLSDVQAKSQRMIVSGKFLCGAKPSDGAQTSAKLLDKNFGMDTNMGKVKMNTDGSFKIDGTSNSISTIDPELHIYTDCNDGIKPCQRKIKFKLPKYYVDDTTGYQVGTFNLEAEFSGEERDCIH